jgi:hypothetical protein
VATAGEAREIMKVGVWDHSIEVTLRHLGLPPNRRAHPIAHCMVPPEPALAAQEPNEQQNVKWSKSETEFPAHSVPPPPGVDNGGWEPGSLGSGQALPSPVVTMPL